MIAEEFQSRVRGLENAMLRLLDCVEKLAIIQQTKSEPTDPELLKRLAEEGVA